MSEPWVSVEKIAGHSGVTRDSIYRWIDSKVLSAYRIDRLWKFKIPDVDNWVRVSGADEKKNNSEGALIVKKPLGSIA